MLERLDRHGTPVVWGMIALYVAVFFSTCVAKYRDYLYRDFDLAIFTQATHGILHGSLFSSIRGMSWLGDHSSLVLFLIAPIYAALPSPLTLLFLQTAALGLGALATYRLARQQFPRGVVPVLFAAAYLLHPAIGYSNLFEFHPETLATSALLFAFAFLRSGRFRPMVACTAFALLCKEDVSLVVLGMAFYAVTLRQPGKLRTAGTLAILAALSLVVSFGILKPMLNAGDVEYGRMYAMWGESPRQVVANVITHPIEAVGALFETPGDPTVSRIKQVYYLELLLPLLFLPLLAPLTLAIGLPILFEHFLSSRHPQQTIVFHYTALLMPFVIAAAVLGAARLERWSVGSRPARPQGSKARGRETTVPRRSLATPVVATAVLSSVVCNLLFGPLWGHHVLLPVEPLEPLRPNAYDRTLAPYRDRMVAKVPRDGGVVAGFQFLARLAGRPAVHSIHHVMGGRYTFSDRPYPIPTGISAMIADLSDEGLLPYQGPGTAERLASMVRGNGLRPADVAGDQVLLLRSPADTVELVRSGTFAIGAPQSTVFDGQLQLAGLDPIESVVAPGGEAIFRTYWRRVAAIDRLYLMDVALIDASNTVRYARGRVLGYGLFPAGAWPADSTVRETGRLLIPADLRPGVYTLALHLRWRGMGGRGAAEPDVPLSADGSIRIGRVEVSGAVTP